MEAQTNNEYTGRRMAQAQAMGSRYLLNLIRGGAATHPWKTRGAATIRAPLLLLSFGPCHSRCLVSSPFNDDFIAA
jgi:hypothetical protein